MQTKDSLKDKSYLNFLVAKYIIENEKINNNLGDSSDNNIIQKFKDGFDFGNIVDFDLNTHKCNYEIMNEICKRLNETSLEAIYENFYDNKIIMQGAIRKPTISKKFNNFNSIRNLRNQTLTMNEMVESKKSSMLKFNQMKSVLGHIQTQDGNTISPVEIFCLGYSHDNELFFTGDNNGLIKIWSSRTGSLVDAFKFHERAINDFIVSGVYLISCSEDSTVKIWDTKRLVIVKSLSFDEPIQRLNSYLYNKERENDPLNIIIANSTSGKSFVFNLNYILREYEAVLEDKIICDDETFEKIEKFYFDKKIIEKYELKKQKTQLKLNSTGVGKNGILVCGFNIGLICVWDLEKIVEESIINNKVLYGFDKYLLFLEFVHNNVVHFVEFNKQNSNFLTGSVDGNILVWKNQEDVIKKIRSNINTLDKNDKDYVYPVQVQGKIFEDDKLKSKCSVNACAWSSNSTFIVTLISSKNKKKIIPQNSNSTSTTIPSNNPNPNVNNEAQKRSSALIVYDLHKEKMIKRLDEEQGFNFHDLCFVLESHPIYDEIILTVLKTNEVVLINILTDQIICKFIEENYFFNNVPSLMIPTEGKFSSQGDMFVISTSLGSVSIYSIYGKASYSGTYMNQFFEDENNKNSNLIYPKFCNMFMLPYIIQQPFSKYKIESFNQQNRENFELLQKNIYYDYHKNFNDRIYECEKEEKIYTEGLRENQVFRVVENSESDSNEGQNVNNDFYYDQESQDVSYENDDGDDEIEEEKISNVDDDDDLIQEEISDEWDQGENYNLRSKRGRPKKNKKFNEYEFENDESVEARIIVENNEESCSFVNNNIETGRRRLRKRNNVNLKENSEKKKRLGMKRRKRLVKKSNLDIPSNIENFSNLDNPSIIEIERGDSGIDLENISQTILENIINEAKEIEEKCEICNVRSKNLIGPFKLEFNSFYHIDCLLYENDFKIMNSFGNLDFPKTIEEIETRNEICLRCNESKATKKCSTCKNYYHSYICLKKHCIMDENNGKQYCFSCYKNYISKKKDMIDSSKGKIERSLIVRNFLCNYDHNDYIYFPQLGDQVYFVIQAYEDFLRENIELILFEIDDFIFWKDQDFFNDNIHLCEISNIEYAFPSEKSVAFIQGNNDGFDYEKLKILIKIELKFVKNNETRFVDIVFFENHNPDFLISKNLFESTKKYYNDLVNRNTEFYLKINLEEGQFEGKFLKETPKEINSFYGNSPFESIMILGEQDKGEKEYLVSFWDIYLPERIPKDNYFLTFCRVFQKVFDEFLSKHKKTYKLFYEVVDVERDQAPNYYNIVPYSIGLEVISTKLSKQYYSNKKSLLFDIQLILSNSILFNGDNDITTIQARKLVDEMLKLVKKSEEIQKGLKVEFDPNINSILIDKLLISPVKLEKENYYESGNFNENIKMEENSIETRSRERRKKAISKFENLTAIEINIEKEPIQERSKRGRRSIVLSKKVKYCENSAEDEEEEIYEEKDFEGDYSQRNNIEKQKNCLGRKHRRVKN